MRSDFGTMDSGERSLPVGLLVCNLHGSVGKYINLSLGGTSQQFNAFKFVKIGVFLHHSTFSRFHREYSFNQFQVNAVVLFKDINAEMYRLYMPCHSKSFKYLSLRMRKRSAWKCDICH